MKNNHAAPLAKID